MVANGEVNDALNAPANNGRQQPWYRLNSFTIIKKGQTRHGNLLTKQAN